MHSIEELNKKIWYRLLKIIYLGAIIVVVGRTLIIGWSDVSDTALFREKITLTEEIPVLLVALLVELLLFELARRVFYYIVLGSWRPKK